MPIYLNSRRLNTRIRIEQRTVTTDADYGTPVETWEHVATVAAEWQEVLPSKSESQNAEIRIERRPVRVRIRYRRGLTADMRVKRMWGSVPWGSRHWWTDTEVYKIIGGPTELGNRDAIEMVVENYSTDGQGS